MRTLILEETAGFPRPGRRHEVSFRAERSTPSGLQADTFLDGVPIGVLRRIDTVSRRTGEPKQVWEVQLRNLHVSHGHTRQRAWQKALPVALAMLERG